ncbi:MAG TPA: cupin domain-containing protein [Candidatus Bathyarchaeia archaeon]|nr:cupin domain-containing protein [Candidatus Bathyarchaeia archaeon]
MHKVTRIEECERTPARKSVDKITLVDSKTGAKNLDVHIMVLKPGGSTNLHHHSTSESVWIVLQGTAQARIEGNEYRLEKNSVIFVPPNVDHEFKAIGEEDYMFIEIFAPPAADHVPAKHP